MGNKTIYVKDDELWNKAKQATGKEGVSRLIEGALREFVAGKERESAGFRTFSIGLNLGPGGVYEHIGFDGRKVAEREVHRDADPWVYTVYATAGNVLVLIARSSEDPPSHPDEYHVCQTLAELVDLREVGFLDQKEREEFMSEVATNLGPGWQVWID